MKEIVLACAIALATVGAIGSVAPATAAVVVSVGNGGWHHHHCIWRHHHRICRHW
jgi:hypothetical protein